MKQLTLLIISSGRWDEERKMSCVKNVLFALFNTITWLVSECVALAAPLDYIDCENLF